MKSTKENEMFKAMGEKAVELIKIAYPLSDVSVEYNEESEVYSFYIDGENHEVNVNWDSVKAGLRDIAKQLLSLELEY